MKRMRYVYTKIIIIITIIIQDKKKHNKELNKSIRNKDKHIVK